MSSSTTAPRRDAWPEQAVRSPPPLGPGELARWAWRHPVTALQVVVLMIASLTLYVSPGPLVPALQSYWLVIHVVAAILATGAFTVGALLSGLYLLQSRRETRSPDETAGTWSRLPGSAVIDEIAFRVHAFGFPLWTFAALIAGPIWAEYAWGRYWGWDPKEVWAFITWGIYAAYLHARVTAGWKGRAAWVAIAGFAALMFNFMASICGAQGSTPTPASDPAPAWTRQATGQRAP